MPPKLMPTTRHALPADRVEQRRRVGRVVGHRVRAGRDRRAAEAPLVVGDDVEVRGEQRRSSRPDWSRAWTPDPLQNSSCGPEPLAFVVDVDPVRGDEWAWPGSYAPLEIGPPRRTATCSPCASAADGACAGLHERLRGSTGPVGSTGGQPCVSTIGVHTGRDSVVPVKKQHVSTAQKNPGGQVKSGAHVCRVSQ